MNNHELLFYLVLVSTNCVIAYHWAAYGFLELSLHRPMKALPVLAVFVGIGTMLAGGFLQRAGFLKLEVLTEANMWLATTYLLGPPLIFMFLVRYIFLPAGVPEYNRARSATQFWTGQNLKLGEILNAEGELLRNFPRAQKVLRYFDKAINVQKKGTIIGSTKSVVSIAGMDSDYHGLYRSCCPACGFELKIPDSTVGVTGQCLACGSVVTAKSIGEQIHVHAFGSLAKKVVLTTENKRNIAVALCEKALLLRMMNRFDEAEQTNAEAREFIEAALQDGPGRVDLISSKSLIVFRAGELAHVKRDKEKALRLYRECLALDESIGRTEESDLVRDLIGSL